MKSIYFECTRFCEALIWSWNAVNETAVFQAKFASNLIVLFFSFLRTDFSWLSYEVTRRILITHEVADPGGEHSFKGLPPPIHPCQLVSILSGRSGRSSSENIALRKMMHRGQTSWRLFSELGASGICIQIRTICPLVHIWFSRQILRNVLNKNKLGKRSARQRPC